jgi:hypothetical protein
MYFNQGLLGPDPEPNPAPKPAPEPEIAPNLDPSLRQKNPHFSTAAFSPFILLPFLQELKTIQKKKIVKLFHFCK